MLNGTACTCFHAKNCGSAPRTREEVVVNVLWNACCVTVRLGKREASAA